MSLQPLRAFVEAARVGSIRKASEVLRVAPSSVSRHIAILENEMGTALFIRRAGGVELTHAGRLVAEYAESVLVNYDTLRTDLNDVRGTQRRLLRLTLVESVASYGPINAVSKFFAKYPTVSFNVRLLPAPRVTEAVIQGHCDIGISFCSQPDPQLLTLSRIPEPIVLVVPPDHPLASASEVQLADVKAMPLALPDVDFGIRQIIDRASAERGIRLTPVLTSNVFGTLRDFVRGGSGVAILPSRAVALDVQEGNLKSIPLLDPIFSDATIDVLVLRKRRLPRIVKLFVDILIADIAEAPLNARKTPSLRSNVSWDRPGQASPLLGNVAEVVANPRSKVSQSL
jgi:DNA-binding transcriptional LysR family regulator